MNIFQHNLSKDDMTKSIDYNVNYNHKSRSRDYSDNNVNRNYYSLYIKYKNKYLNLKKSKEYKSLELYKKNEPNMNFESQNDLENFNMDQHDYAFKIQDIFLKSEKKIIKKNHIVFSTKIKGIDGINHINLKYRDFNPKNARSNNMGEAINRGHIYYGMGIIDELLAQLGFPNMAKNIFNIKIKSGLFSETKDIFFKIDSEIFNKLQVDNNDQWTLLQKFADENYTYDSNYTMKFVKKDSKEFDITKISNKDTITLGNDKIDIEKFKKELPQFIIDYIGLYAEGVKFAIHLSWILNEPKQIPFISPEINMSDAKKIQVFIELLSSINSIWYLLNEFYNNIKI